MSRQWPADQCFLGESNVCWRVCCDLEADAACVSHCFGCIVHATIAGSIIKHHSCRLMNVVKSNFTLASGEADAAETSMNWDMDALPAPSVDSHLAATPSGVPQQDTAPRRFPHATDVLYLHRWTLVSWHRILGNPVRIFQLVPSFCRCLGPCMLLFVRDALEVPWQTYESTCL